MRCISCGADIPPQWVKAIETNTCPGCGCEIMNSLTKDLLDELATAMQKMPNDPQGVAGWLLSNYRFQKIGTAEPVEKFHRKGSSTSVAVGDSNTFVERGGTANLINKGKELENKLKSLKNGKMASFAEAIQSISDEGDDFSGESDVGDEEDKMALIELKAGGFNPFSSDGDSPKSPINPKDVIKLMSSDRDKPLAEEIALESTSDGRNFLNNTRLKKLKAQEAISGGGGSFRR